MWQSEQIYKYALRIGVTCGIGLLIVLGIIYAEYPQYFLSYLSQLKNIAIDALPIITILSICIFTYAYRMLSKNTKSK